jgi:hypothetical protein
MGQQHFGSWIAPIPGEMVADFEVLLNLPLRHPVLWVVA